MRPSNGNAAPAWTRYFYALLAVAFATVLRLAMDPWLGPEAVPYSTFGVAMAFAALLWGRNAGLVATFAGGVACDYFIIMPRHTFVMTALGTVPMGFFWATGVIVSILAGRMHATRRVAEQREQALRRSENRLARAAQIGQLGLWEHDLSAVVTYLDDRCRAILGIDEGPVPAERAYALIAPEDRLRLEETARVALDPDGTGFYETELRICRRDGTERWIAARGQVTRSGADGRGRIARIAGTLMDITERKQLECQRDALLESEREARSIAERAARAKDDFLAMLSHELRNPLNSILGWAHILQQGRVRADEVAGAHQAISQSARLLRQLIEDLLDMSRLTSGKLKLNTERINIASLAQEAVAMFHPEAQARKVRLEARSTHGHAEVLGDSARLKQVLGNLLSNAVKFTPAGVRVLVRLGCTREHAVIAIKDTGIGIAPDFLPQLFQLFRQADVSSTRTYRGLGLGLALVKRLTELHGGSVRARSKGRGCGALFVLRLPLLGKSGLDPGAPLNAASAALDVDLEGLTLLVVDDEPHTLAFVMRVLSEAGAKVATCTSAADAWRAIEQCPFDVLISDISMPGEDGCSLIRKVRHLPDSQRASMPALAVTAFSRSGDEQRALEAGFQRYMVKPVEAAELCLAVAKLTGRVASEAPTSSPA